MTDKIDISSFQIAASKMRADGNAYFKLFEKHIPVGHGENSTILLYKIDNMSCIAKIVDMNNSAKYIVVTNDATAAALRIVLNKSINVNYLKDFDFEKNDMKFDCIIMNPPYQRNLHLKILAEAIKHLKDEKSVCVNLSPVRWLQDPLAKYKKNCDLKRFEESVVKHIESLDVFFPKEMSDTFGIQIKTDIAVYVANSSLNNSFDFTTIPNASCKSIKFIQSLYERILKAKLENVDSKLSTFKDKTTSNYVFTIAIGGTQQRGPEQETHDFVRRGKYGAFIDDLFNGKTAKEIKAADKRSVWGDVDNWPVICFSSGDEAKNFFNSACTSFMRYLAWAFSSDQHVPSWAIPWLGDAINPRTGLKGYASEWTDEDFVLYFNITPEEYNIIKKTMEKYK